MNFTQSGLAHFYTDSHPQGTSLRTLVLIHGFPHTHQLWAPQVADLSKQARVITYDLRGFGKSEAGDGHLMVEFFVDDLIALLDHLKLAQVTVGGLSMGGYIALRAVERHPERFDALILSNTGAEADSNAGKLKRADFIRKLRNEGHAVFTEDFIQGVFMPETLARDPAMLDRFREMVLQNDPDTISAGFIALAARMDMLDSLRKIRVPTLIIAGGRDQVTPIALSERMHQEIVGSHLQVIAGVGHLSNWEDPESFNRHVGQFLREAPSRN